MFYATSLLFVALRALKTGHLATGYRRP